MTKLINGKTNENELNIIQTSAYSEPELVLPNNFTALHIAHICANLYSGTCPSDLMPDFTICENGDFAMYNVHVVENVSHLGHASIASITCQDSIDTQKSQTLFFT